MNWSRATRLRAAELFEKGYGYKAVSTKLGVNRETVRDWSYTWRALGSKEFCVNKSGYSTYSREVKLSAVYDRLKGDSMVEVMQRYKIRNRHRIKDWCNLYDREGASAFQDDD